MPHSQTQAQAKVQSAGNTAATTQSVEEGPEFVVTDPDLDVLLNLSADIVKGRCNHDTGVAWLAALERVEKRLAKVPPAGSHDRQPSPPCPTCEGAVAGESGTS